MRKIANFVKGTFYILFTFLLFPIARICLFRKSIWLINERPNEARDNGLALYEFLCKNKPYINCFYAIEYDSADYKKVKQLGKVIKYGSLKHLFVFCGAKYIISSDVLSFCPNYYLERFRRKFGLFGKYVFLQHGITHNMLDYLKKDNSKIDLFICGAKPEYDFIISEFGYDENSAKYTGFARFDKLCECYKNKKDKTILIMPTWRRNADDEDLSKSDYFVYWNSLLNNELFLHILDSSGYIVYFYLHPLFQKYHALFSSNSNRVIICSANKYDVQKLLTETSLLITDYSSVFFDFAYMEKPLIYYQFDKSYFQAAHYKKGYFDYSKDGFGPIAQDLKTLCNILNNYITNNCELEEEYKKRSAYFFLIKDNNNCLRIYNVIKDMK